MTGQPSNGLMPTMSYCKLLHKCTLSLHLLSSRNVANAFKIGWPALLIKCGDVGPY